MDLSFILEDGTCLWHVGLVPDDEADSIFPGTSTIMGPDGKIWTFPYNPNFFDREIAERAPTHLYIEGVADLVDPDSLCEQVNSSPDNGTKQSLRSMPLAEGNSGRCQKGTDGHFDVPRSGEVNSPR